jgi:hypothetical protein
MDDTSKRVCTCGALANAIPKDEKYSAIAEIWESSDPAAVKLTRDLALIDEWYRREVEAVAKYCTCSTVDDEENEE